MTCVICKDRILPDEETRTNKLGGVMHAECDPEAVRCPHCEGVLND